MINFIEKEQIWQDETTRYWFSVDEEVYCLADQNGTLTLLDSDGFPIEVCNDHKQIKAKLEEFYESITKIA